ncbi:hypothetical protein [Phormidesmis priestleyi]
MTTITLQLSPELEARLRESLDRHDTKSFHQLLAEAFAPTVEAMLQKNASAKLEEFDRLLVELDALNDEILANHGSLPVLSDYAVSREGIYEDHL